MPGPDVGLKMGDSFTCEVGGFKLYDEERPAGLTWAEEGNVADSRILDARSSKKADKEASR